MLRRSFASLTGAAEAAAVKSAATTPAAARRPTAVDAAAPATNGSNSSFSSKKASPTASLPSPQNPHQKSASSTKGTLSSPFETLATPSPSWRIFPSPNNSGKSPASLNLSVLHPDFLRPGRAPTGGAAKGPSVAANFPTESKNSNRQRTSKVTDRVVAKLATMAAGRKQAKKSTSPPIAFAGEGRQQLQQHETKLAFHVLQRQRELHRPEPVTATTRVLEPSVIAELRRMANSHRLQRFHKKGRRSSSTGSSTSQQQKKAGSSSPHQQPLQQVSGADLIWSSPAIAPGLAAYAVTVVGRDASVVGAQKFQTPNGAANGRQGASSFSEDKEDNKSQKPEEGQKGRNKNKKDKKRVRSNSRRPLDSLTGKALAHRLCADFRNKLSAAERQSYAEVAPEIMEAHRGRTLAARQMWTRAVRAAHTKNTATLVIDDTDGSSELVSKPDLPPTASFVERRVQAIMREHVYCGGEDKKMQQQQQQQQTKKRPTYNGTPNAKEVAAFIALLPEADTATAAAVEEASSTTVQPLADAVQRQLSKFRPKCFPPEFLVVWWHLCVQQRSTASSRLSPQPSSSDDEAKVPQAQAPAAQRPPPSFSTADAARFQTCRRVANRCLFAAAWIGLYLAFVGACASLLVALWWLTSAFEQEDDDDVRGVAMPHDDLLAVGESAIDDHPGLLVFGGSVSGAATFVTLF